MTKLFWLACLNLMMASAAYAVQTEYYTMVGSKINPRECKMEGNQIINGVLVGSDCSPRGVNVYCPWGIGNRSNCIVPCVHCVGPQSSWGKSIRIQPVTCPWGPLKGRRVTSCIVADSGPGHVDMFLGLCKRKKPGTDNCAEYVPDTTVASYGAGRGKEYQVAAALVDRYAPGAGNILLAQVGGTQPTIPTGQRPSGGTGVAQRPPAPLTPAPVRPAPPVRLTSLGDGGGSSFFMFGGMR